MISKSVKAFALGVGLLVSSTIEARIFFISGHTGTDRWAIVYGLVRWMPEAKLHTANLYEWSKMIDFARHEGFIESDVDLTQEGRLLCNDQHFLAAREMILALGPESVEIINEFRMQLDWQPWVDGIESDAREGDVIVGGILGDPALSSIFGATLGDGYDMIMVQAYTGFDDMPRRVALLNQSPYKADHRRMIDVVAGFLGLYTRDFHSMEAIISSGEFAPEDVYDAYIISEDLTRVLEHIEQEEENSLSLRKNIDQDSIKKQLAAFIEEAEGGVAFKLKRKRDLFLRSARCSVERAVDAIFRRAEGGCCPIDAAALNTEHGLWG